MKSKILLALAISIFCVAGTAWSKQLRAAFVYVGPVGDGGWTYSHDLGRKHLESLGVKTSYVESVSESDSFRTIRKLARRNDLVFTTSFGYMDATLRTGKKFPKTIFMHATGFKTAKNVGTYFGRLYQAQYLAGMVAGYQTKSNMIGMIGSHPISEIVRHINAFTMGARAANPKAQVKVLWINSWFDPAKEVAAANSLLDSGADIIAISTDSAAPLQAAQKRGAFSIGKNTDMSAVAPKSHLTSPIFNWGIIYEDLVNKVKNKTWKPSQEWWGLETNVVDLSPMSDLVPQSVQAAVNKRKQEIINKEFVIFEGPFKKQDGSLAAKAGQTLTDQELLSMSYFVEGVIGKAPGK